MVRKLTIKKYQILIFLYIILSFIIYLSIADYLIQEGSYQSLDEFFENLSYENNMGLHLWADSSTYTALSKQYALNEILAVLALNPNYMGPFIILKIFNSNEFLIYLFNIVLFFCSVSILKKYYSINKYKFFSLLFISPMLFSSLLSINKEIFAMFSVSFFLAYSKNKKPLFLIVCLLSAIIARWQLAFVMIIFIMSFSKYNYFRNKRLAMVIIYLVSISLLYPIFTKNLFANVHNVALQGAIEWEGKGTGLFPFWLDLQNNFLYFVVFIPKTIHLLVGTISQFNIDKIINKIDFYNSFIVVFQSIAWLFLLTQIIMKKAFNIKNDISYTTLLFCIFISMTPIFAPRYLFPSHLLFALMLSIRKFPKAHGLPNKVDPTLFQP